MRRVVSFVSQLCPDARHALHQVAATTVPNPLTNDPVVRWESLVDDAEAVQRRSSDLIGLSAFPATESMRSNSEAYLISVILS
jgi:hypothetical protein